MSSVIWLWVVLIVVVIGALSVVLASRGGTMAEVYDDRPDATIPAGRPLTADDLRNVRFSSAVRGYRMDEVDALLSRLQADLISREGAVEDAKRFEMGNAKTNAAERIGTFEPTGTSDPTGTAEATGTSQATGTAEPTGTVESSRPDVSADRAKSGGTSEHSDGRPSQA